MSLPINNRARFGAKWNFENSHVVRVVNYWRIRVYGSTGKHMQQGQHDVHSATQVSHRICSPSSYIAVLGMVLGFNLDRFIAVLEQNAEWRPPG